MRTFEQWLPMAESELSARLEHLPGAFRLHDEHRTFVGALPAARSHELDPVAGSESLPVESLDDWPWWVGVLPYEAFRGGERGPSQRCEDLRELPHISRVIWVRYDAVARVVDEGLLVRARDAKALEAFVGSLRGEQQITRQAASLNWAAAPEDGQIHRERVRAALDRIARGELYQVNLSRRFEFRATGGALALLSSLGPLAEAPFAAALDLGEVQVVSTSPELFLDYRPDGSVATRPIKGTRPRSSDPQEDARLARELDLDEKERAELAMVIDIERNDLGRLAIPGTVAMADAPRVVKYPTVHHREATVSARLEARYGRADLLEATMPSGSVTGAPKVSAMDLIADLEAHRRGLYTGALGYIDGTGGMRLSMAIRVLTVRDGLAHYFTGGGIVADSDPDRELQETNWKAEQLRALVSI